MRLFRPAAEAPDWRNLGKTGLQTVCFWSVLLWIVPVAIQRFETRMGAPTYDLVPAVGIALLVVSSLGGLWSGWTMALAGRGTPFPMDTARELVTSGPYSLVRNPMAVTGLSQGLGVALLLGSWGAVAYVLLGGFLWQFFVRPLEEKNLEERFGEDYRHYKSRVGLWVPKRRAT